MHNPGLDCFESTTLLLVRHGQARPGDDGNYGADAPLTALGRRQASALAANLRSGPLVDAIYASNLPRALESAAAVAECLGKEVLVDARLAEFNWDLDPSALSIEQPELLVWKPEHTGVDGKTLAQFASRVAEFHDEIVTRHLRHRVAIICHAGTIEMSLWWSLGIAPGSPWQTGVRTPERLDH